MTTQFLRHRRMLSMNRRTGLQVPPDAASGRSPRHEQSYRDLHMAEDDALRVARALIRAIALGAVVWGVLLGFVWGAVQVLG